ncbi:hypothetical protein Tco_1084333 [Tanacetum coccineum]
MCYLRSAQLINDMNTIGITMKKLQVNTKFVNNLQLEWSKFVTDVKLAKDMHKSSFNQLYAYLRQHEVHANEVRMMRERFPDLLALVANTYNTPPYIQFRRISLTGFPAQSVRSFNAGALDSLYLLVLVIRTSKSGHHDKKSRKSPTAELFDVDSGRISIVTVNTKEYHSDVLEIITRIMLRTLL